MNLVATYITGLKAARGRSYLNLTMFPLLAGVEEKPDYLTVKEALERKFLRIVPTFEDVDEPVVSLVNDSRRPILIVESEQLLGSEPGMLAAASFLAPPKAAMTIPTGVLVEISQEGEADRSRTWELPGEKPDLFGSPVVRVEDFIRRFRPVECQVGAVFAIDGEIQGLEAFDRPETWIEHFPRLVERYARVAMSRGNSKEGKVSPAEVQRFLAAVGKCDMESRPGFGMGIRLRIKGNRLAGSALSEGTRILHISMDGQESQYQDGPESDDTKGNPGE
ncbi:MAG: DUF6569 family protein [bacterium]